MIHIFNSLDRLAGVLGDNVISLVEDAHLNGREFNIALSGGRTPRILFEKIASTSEESGVWEHVNFYWVDERCVPPDHPDSNYRMTNEALLQHLPLNNDHIYRMIGEEEPHREAMRYAGLLQEQIPTRDGLPRFDLILLGMGADGHTASIFPDQMELLHAERLCEVARHPETGQHRLTLTGPVINNADKIFFMVTGQNKATLLASILDAKSEKEKFPAAHIKPSHGKLEWYLDEAAAKLLNK